MTISYTTDSWNPIIGCSPTSRGCVHCYAAREAGTRLKGVEAYKGLAKKRGPALGEILGATAEDDASGGFCFTGKVALRENVLDQVLRKSIPQVYFVCSTSDLFYEGITDEWVDEVVTRMLLTPWHTYLVLTKRPEEAYEYFFNLHLHERLQACAERIVALRPRLAGVASEGLSYVKGVIRIPPWIWMGTSIECDSVLEKRSVQLAMIPATRRWVSFSPLLEHLLRGASVIESRMMDWFVIEGESGSDARVYCMAWGQRLLEAGERARIPGYMKQMGSRCLDGFGARINFKHPHGADPAEWPEWLRVRQLPKWRDFEGAGCWENIPALTRLRKGA